MTDSKQPKKRSLAAPRPGPARLVALFAGMGLALLGVLGFFYDASFGTGSQLASDDLAGILYVNGWRNVIYLATGAVALAFAPRSPRVTAFGLGVFYLAFGLWGLAETDRGIGSILDALPLGDRDNALHLIIGGTGLIAALVDGPLPSLPKRREKKPRKPKPAKAAKPSKGAKTAKPAKSPNPTKPSKTTEPAKPPKPATASGGRRRSPAAPRGGDGDAPR